MATTSVKMDQQDKRRLDRLQARILQRTGRRVSLQELLALLTRYGESNIERLVSDVKPPTEKQIAALMRLPVDTGVESSEETIDEDIYGGEA